jgi:P-type Mg2+ transporter
MLSGKSRRGVTLHLCDAKVTLPGGARPSLLLFRYGHQPLRPASFSSGSPTPVTDPRDTTFAATPALTAAVSSHIHSDRSTGDRWDPHPMLEAASGDSTTALGLCGSDATGLATAEAERRLGRYGPNEIAAQRPMTWRVRLLRALRNPLVILLSALAAISIATGDVRSAIVMTVMVALGVGLRFFQEARADRAAAALRAMIHVTATAVRDGVAREVPLATIVPGDVIRLGAGDMIPGDVRLLTSKDLFVSQGSLTGESLPVEKTDLAHVVPGQPAVECPALCFLGTSVQSGTASAVVVRTGRQTLFGSMAGSVAAHPTPTAFDRGIDRFTWLMIRFMAVMVPLVFLINGLTKHDWKQAFFFALAVAVGLTPEMLPTIVSVCLSKGAEAMSKRKVIVKRLNAIQNFGAMDVLCTDKTGTLTQDTIILEKYCDVEGEPSDAVLRDALLISHLQTGLKSALDAAVLQHLARHSEFGIDGYQKIDEIPFDFSRKIMSVVVQGPTGPRRLLAKGAPEAILSRCRQVESVGGTAASEGSSTDTLRKEYDLLSAQGFRVLAVATKEVVTKPAYDKQDECDLVLGGYIAFLDPPKETAITAIAALTASGVSVKILTGDNELVTRTVCTQVQLPVDHIYLGSQLVAMTESELQQAVEHGTIFARLAPLDKERIIRALQSRQHVVGFMGDGINDAAALHAADVSISVDTAVDVAKEAASIVLLEKSLMVLHDGVVEGRKVFQNILKYIRMGASSNFGNMFSVLGASALLPFLPMAPIQVLTNNLLYDFSQVPIPTDNVDQELIARPCPWDIGAIGRYIVTIGPISSIFDYTTYALMWFIFGATTVTRAHLFQTGWFVESLMTQTLIIHVIRTNKIPFFQSRASWPLLINTAAIMLVGSWLPFSPFAGALGFVPLPGLYWPLLALTLFAYVLLTQCVKVLLLRRRWL